jgi:hypothetical protein
VTAKARRLAARARLAGKLGDRDLMLARAMPWEQFGTAHPEWHPVMMHVWRCGQCPYVVTIGSKEGDEVYAADRHREQDHRGVGNRWRRMARA